jgi:hypothetical protein
VLVSRAPLSGPLAGADRHTPPAHAHTGGPFPPHRGASGNTVLGAVRRAGATPQHLFGSHSVKNTCGRVGRELSAPSDELSPKKRF